MRPTLFVLVLIVGCCALLSQDDEQYLRAHKRVLVATASGYSDNFPGSSLSGNWTCYVTGQWVVPPVSGAKVNNAVPNGTPETSFCGYTAGTFATNQHSQFSNNSYNSSTYLGSTAACVNMTPASGNGYCFGDTSVGSNFVKLTAGVATGLGTYCPNGYGAQNDVLRVTNTAGSLVAYDVTTSTTLCSASDSTYTGGVPGFAILYSSGFSVTNSLSAWSGQ